MPSWGDDPELVATFRAEVEDRLASLAEGLLSLESHPRARDAVQGLFRDAHTVKGSAKMLGLEHVVSVAHLMEDLLGDVRDGRIAVRPDVIGILLTSCDAVERSLPGAGAPLSEVDLTPVVEALQAAIAGDDPLTVPLLPQPESPLPERAPASSLDAMPEDFELFGKRTPGNGANGNGSKGNGTNGNGTNGNGSNGSGHSVGASAEASVDTASAEQSAPAAPVVRAGRDSADAVRVAASKVYDLIDAVGEAALGARRVEQTSGLISELVTEHTRWTKSLRKGAGERDVELPERVTLALHRLSEVGEQIQHAGHQLREFVETEMARIAVVRDGAMSLAMVPLGRVVAAFPRLVRDVSVSLQKDVALEIEGDDVELDKQVLDGVADALKHLVINAVDHGCESPEDRVLAGKPARATVRVSARASGGHVVIEVSDDGGGIDEDKLRAKAISRGLLAPDSTLSGTPLLQVLFTPEFSTADVVTQTSGRGVGLDVVKTAVDALGGSIEIRTAKGEGTTFSLQLPVTLGVIRCLIARIGTERFAIPVTSVAESIGLDPAAVGEMAGAPVISRHGASLPLLDLGDALDVREDREPRAALVVRHGDRQIAWVVDRLEGETELVIKDLGTFLGRIPGISGATIAGDGTVVPLVDLRELADRALGFGLRMATSGPITPAGRPSATEGRRIKVLVVEDSVGVRELERVILEGAGYSVETAVDGLDGASRLRPEPVDLVISDVEMPGMDGFTLTRTIRRTKGWEQVPVVIMTSCGTEADRRAGLEAGANAYLLKNEFDQHQLLETVRRLVGG